MRIDRKPRVWPVVLALLAIGGVTSATVFKSAITFSRSATSWLSATGANTGEGMYDNNGFPVWHASSGAELIMTGPTSTTGYQQFEYNGSPLTPRTTFNMSGKAAICTDNGTSLRTDCVMRPQNWFNVQDYGTVSCNGTSDDTAAVNAAVAAADVAGGTVYFPTPCRYTITSTVLISSVYPVNLTSDMSGFTDNNTANGSYIAPGANFGATPMFEYQAPGGAHGSHGGGHVHGLVVHDSFNALATFPGQYIGNYTMSAALDLEDFNFGTVDDCQFQVLNGSAIHVVQMVMGKFDNLVIRYSGSATQPAFDLAGYTSPASIQSVSITNSRIEVNFGTYLSLNGFTTEIKVSNIGMEAETVITGLLGSNNTMVLNAGSQNQFANLHLNRDNATQWNDSGSRTQATNIIVADSSAKPATTPSILISGSESEYHTIQVRGATSSTVPQVHVTGTYDRIFGLDLAFSGGLLVDTGSFDQIFGFQAASINSASGTAVADLSGSYMLLDGCMINSPPVNEHGVRVFGTAFNMTVSNCIVFGSSGTGVSFRDENASNTTSWGFNHSKSSVTNFSNSNSSYIARGNDWGGVESETIQNGSIDSAHTMFVGVTTSNGTSISKTGTLMTVNGSTYMAQGMSAAFRTATTPVTVAVTDYFVGVNGTGARSVTLPAASTCKHAGQQFVVQETGGSTGTITFSRNGSDTINGTTTAAMSTAYGRQIITCDGVSSWYFDPAAI